VSPRLDAVRGRVVDGDLHGTATIGRPVRRAGLLLEVRRLALNSRELLVGTGRAVVCLSGQAEGLANGTQRWVRPAMLAAVALI
jgi:hypothetical protein